MFGISLQEVCNVVILVSAVIIAAKNIYGFFKKPVNDLHNKARGAEEQRIEQVLEKRVPELLKQHSENVKLEREQETRENLDSIKDTVIGAINDRVEELKQFSQKQKEQIEKVQYSIDLLNQAQLDSMRYNMNRIYYKYRHYKKILDYDKKAFIKFYDDYHSRGGNTWIDELYKEVKDWEIVQDENELEVKK